MHIRVSIVKTQEAALDGLGAQSSVNEKIKINSGTHYSEMWQHETKKDEEPGTVCTKISSLLKLVEM